MISLLHVRSQSRGGEQEQLLSCDLAQIFHNGGNIRENEAWEHLV